MWIDSRPHPLKLPWPNPDNEQCCVCTCLVAAAGTDMDRDVMDTRGEDDVDQREVDEDEINGLEDAWRREKEGKMDKWHFHFHLSEGKSEQLEPHTHTRTKRATLWSPSIFSWDHVEHKAKRSWFLHNGCICDTVGEAVCLISLSTLFYISVPLARCSQHTHNHTLMCVCACVVSVSLPPLSEMAFLLS